MYGWPHMAPCPRPTKGEAPATTRGLAKELCGFPSVLLAGEALGRWDVPCAPRRCCRVELASRHKAVLEAGLLGDRTLVGGWLARLRDSKHDLRTYRQNTLNNTRCRMGTSWRFNSFGPQTLHYAWRFKHLTPTTSCSPAQCPKWSIGCACGVGRERVAPGPQPNAVHRQSIGSIRSIAQARSAELFETWL